MVLGLFGVFFVENILKKIISLSILGNGINLTLIAMSYKKGGISPIKLPDMSLEVFSNTVTYPLAHALVLTNIVIGASMLAIMLSLSIILYKKYKTLKSSVLLKE